MNLAHPSSRPFFKSHPHINPQSLKKPSRWYLPAMAAIALGFGAYNHFTATQSTAPTNLQSQAQLQQQEEERLRKNRALMDAYGEKETLQDIERALVVYDLQ
ncbi:uncharacterized protein BP01DRAFT_358407 [Aspergillus saccharolyticus JOP 1030-1]|uniref:Uncharacterized protein n=1 Tax=Aspergillus saccharolyticus JOP 1030-1 TaxID=1450539 RepID=A0A319A9J2_9EURO|nr:hypothetical protein BP01DRAFT_358407 [Aspergillus saccharolyticus JOP 1030-1]PYH43682.1 hypothetical protein BP01DRAFT_358407 [Aspergillus saccharolyticus JOP 1030-1]